MTRTARTRFDRHWVSTLPLPAYFGMVTVLYGLVTWLFDAAGNHRHATWADLVLHVVIGSLYGVGMTGVVALQRRRLGGSALASATAAAIRTGRAPGDADRDVWTPIVQRRLQMMRRSRWLSPLLMAPIVGFAIAAWLLAPAAAVPAVWLIGLSLIVIAVAEVQALRSIPRALTVLDQLQAAPEGVAAPGAPSAPASGTRPRSVVLALIACGAAICGVVAELAVFVLTPGDVAHAAHSVSANDGIALARAEQLAGVAVTIVVGYWLVLIVALAVFGWFAFRGRNWGRAALVPTALLTVVELIAHKPLSIAVTAAAVAAVVLLYLPSSTAFVGARRSGRASG